MDTFETQLVDFQKKALKYAYKFYLYSKDNREDLVADTILKMIQNRSSFQDGTSIEAWGYFIMRNNFINEYRATERHGTSATLDDPEVYIQPSTSDHDPFRFDQLTDALADLSFDYKKLLICYARGYKYQEIAERFNLNIGTVKSKIWQARQLLIKNE